MGSRTLGRHLRLQKWSRPVSTCTHKCTLKDNWSVLRWHPFVSTWHHLKNRLNEVEDISRMVGTNECLLILWGQESDEVPRRKLTRSCLLKRTRWIIRETLLSSERSKNLGLVTPLLLGPRQPTVVYLSVVRESWLKTDLWGGTCLLDR